MQILNQHILTSTFLFGAVGLALGSALNAQISPKVQHGPASALAAGISLHSAVSDEILLKSPQKQTGFPPTWSAGLFGVGPDYRLSAMFGAQVGAVIEIDAQSTGNDFLPPLLMEGPGLPDGSIDVPGSSSWVGLTVSVDNAATGLPGSLISQRISGSLGLSGRTSPGADLVTYYFEGSQGIHSSLVGSTLLEQPSEQLGFDPAVTGSTGEEDVDALDYGLSVTSYAGTTLSSLFFSNPGEYYFSISASSIGAVNAATVPPNQFTLNNQPADPISVYVIYWDGISWSKPELFRSGSDLSLSLPGDDLDALAVDSTSGTVVFSSVVNPGTSQLRIQSYDTFGKAIVFDLKTSSGQLVTINTGSNDNSDDIDAVCIFDPEAGQLGTLLGIPIGVPGFPFSVPTPMGISVTRSEIMGVDTVRAEASGWGGLLPADGIVQFIYSLEQAPTIFDWYLGSGFARMGSDELVDWSIPLPPGVSLPYLSVAAVAFTPGVGFAETWISQFTIQ